MIGRTLGHFRIESALGAGGMGEVFLAHDLKLDRRVALKFMQPSLAHDPEGRRRFEREARALAALDHPNVGAVYGVEEAEGRPFIVLAYVEGPSLARLLSGGALPPERARALLAGIARGLAAAHARGIVHRDLKADNVVVGARDVPRIVDFGIALREGDTRYTETGVSAGTPGYAAPEVLLGNAPDARSDLFALGVIAWQMLTGTHPFARPHPAATLNAVLNEEPAPFAAALPEATRALEPLVRRLIAKDPASRFTSAAEVIEALEGRAAVASAPLADRASTSPPNTPAARDATTVAMPLRASRPRLPLAVALGGVAIALVVAAMMALDRAPATPPAEAAPPSVAVLEFENVTGDPALDWMKRGVAELLGTALTQSQGLDVYDAQRLADLASGAGARDAGSANLDFLRRQKIARAIAGTVMRSGDRLRLQGRLLDVGTGRVLHAASADGAVDGDLFELVARLIPSLQVALEVNLTGDREAESWLREITTTSADAYRLYLQGHQALLSSRWGEASELLGRAVALDSSFVAAHVDRMGAQWNLGDEAGLEATRRILERLRPRADERARLRIDLMEATVRYDAEGLVRSAAQLSRLYPENRLYRYLLGRGHHTGGHHRECVAALAPLVAQRYEWAWTYVLSARSYRALGLPDSAAAVLTIGREVTRGDPELLLEYARLEGSRGSRDRMQALLEEALRSPKLSETPYGEGQIRLELGRLYASRGDLARARAELERSLAKLPRDDARHAEARAVLDSLARS